MHVDITSVSLRYDLPGNVWVNPDGQQTFSEPDPHLPLQAVRHGVGRLSLTLEVVGRPEQVAGIAFQFRSQPGSMEWLVLLCEALAVGEPGQAQPKSGKEECSRGCRRPCRHMDWSPEERAEYDRMWDR